METKRKWDNAKGANVQIQKHAMRLTWHTLPSEAIYTPTFVPVTPPVQHSKIFFSL